MKATSFVDDLRCTFPDYKFKLVRVGYGWCRVFVSYNGVTQGRISLKPTNADFSEHRLYTWKFYKPRAYEFALEDRFFYLFHYWYSRGEIPKVDFEQLVREAKQRKAEKVAKQRRWRARNPLYRPFIVGSDGICVAEPKRRKRLETAWMGEFRKLVGDAIYGAHAIQVWHASR